MTSSPSIARLKITLDDVEPAVVRRLEVPLDLRLDRLHLVLQAALGWSNSHLWEFRARDVGWGRPDPEWDRGSGPLDARKATLLKVIEDTGAKTLTYLYDFGDGWEHTIKVERIEPGDPAVTYPRLLEAVGRCPPEDVGGPPGYEEFLEALADPEHERHAEMTEWYGESFDPHAIDPTEINRAIQDVARRWSRSRRSKPT
jgi:Plasmid pRiA4b ORF-3-like protein